MLCSLALSAVSLTKIISSLVAMCTIQPLQTRSLKLPLRHHHHRRSLPSLSSSLNSPEEPPPPPPPPSSPSSPPAGRIKRLVLPPEGRTKLNSSPDRDFYSFPRFVTHVDDGFIATLTGLYKERLQPGSDVLDLMSSWVSHLPKDMKYSKVVGHGLNALELSRNASLDYFFVKDLNQEQLLQLESCRFDAVVCAVSVQYLQWPEKVFAEVFRVLKPGGVFIVSFSNRMFYDKAIRSWRDGTAYSRIQLVVQYFQCVDGFTQPEVIRKLPAETGESSPLDWVMRLVGMSASDPFYAVIAYRNYRPIYESEANQ